METKEIKQKKRHIGLFAKTYLNFALLVSGFAVTLGIIYLNLYKQATLDDFETQMRSNANIVAEKCAKFVNESSYKDVSLTWSEYWLMAKETMNVDIWPISNPEANYSLASIKIGLNLDKSYFAGTEPLMDEHSYENMTEVANNVFRSKRSIVPVKVEYVDAYGGYMMTLGVPVRGMNGEIAGAIILMAQVEIQQEVVRNGQTMIFISSAVALAASFIVAFFFATMLTKPIAEVQQTALVLANGDYNIKTGINKRNDEIGDLANSMDYLAGVLQKTEVERANMEQMRLDFFANVSHELRTPITVLRAYTESMLDGMMDEEKKEQCYQKMLRECQSMQRLVNDLLILSKMQNPDFMVEREPVNLVQIFDDIIRTAKTIAEEKRIQIHTEKERDIYMISGDYDRIRQMFLVIFDNAVKFSNEDSTIYIKLYGSDDVRVSIRDEGIGIAKEDLDNIFDKFYKSKLRQNATGSGLGLTIAKHIAMKHDGTIEVKSEPNVGTEFIFIFPLLEYTE